MRLAGTHPMHRVRAPVVHVGNRKRLRLLGTPPFLRGRAPHAPRPLPKWQVYIRSMLPPV